MQFSIDPRVFFLLFFFLSSLLPLIAQLRCIVLLWAHNSSFVGRPCLRQLHSIYFSLSLAGRDLAGIQPSRLTLLSVHALMRTHTHTHTGTLGEGIQWNSRTGGLTSPFLPCFISCIFYFHASARLVLSVHSGGIYHGVSSSLVHYGCGGGAA